MSEFGRVDVVCNNAGTVGKNLPTWEFERVEWEWIMAVDFWGVLHGISAFVPRLVAQGSGHIVNTASMAALTTVALNGPYNAAKHAVLSLSETLAADLRAQRRRRRRRDRGLPRSHADQADARRAGVSGPSGTGPRSIAG